MANYTQLPSNISDSDLFNKLKSGYILANVKKADGSSSLRLMTANAESLASLMGTRISNTDKGKARKAHWTDGLSEQEKNQKYITNEKPLFIADAIRKGNKGASIYLNNILREKTIGDLPNLVYFEKSALENDENYTKLLENELDILDFLQGNTSAVKERVNEDKVKQLLDKLDKDVYFATFRKKTGEPRKMIMTRNKEVIETLSPGVYDAKVKLDESDEKDAAKLLKMYDTTSIPVFDLKEQEMRVFTMTSSIEIPGFPRLKKLDAQNAVRYSIGEIEMEELLQGSKLKRRVESTGKSGAELEAHIINLVNSKVPLDELWTYRLNKLYVAVNENLRKEIAQVNRELANDLKIERFKENKIIAIKIPKAKIALYISPKGIFDGVTGKYEYKSNSGIKGTDVKLNGIKNQQDRYVYNKAGIGEFKAMLLFYILESFKKKSKIPELVFMNDRFMHNQ